MTNIIIKNNKKLKVNHRKNVAKFVLSYTCPSCGEILGLSSQSIFTRVDYGYEIWICDKCGKLWRLAFQELIEEAEK
jgi:transcription elongation factor Elf1